jgi:hypothetical protein
MKKRGLFETWPARLNGRRVWKVQVFGDNVILFPCKSYAETAVRGLRNMYKEGKRS